MRAEVESSMKSWSSCGRAVSSGGVVMRLEGVGDRVVTMSPEKKEILSFLGLFGHIVSCPESGTNIIMCPESQYVLCPESGTNIIMCPESQYVLCPESGTNIIMCPESQYVLCPESGTNIIMCPESQYVSCPESGTNMTLCPEYGTNI